MYPAACLFDTTIPCRLVERVLVAMNPGKVFITGESLLETVKCET